MGGTLFKPGAASGLTNPMTTAGDIIYGDVGGTPLRLAPGTSAQYLAGGATPAWVNLPGAYAANVYYPQSSSNYWSVASVTFADFAVVGTIPTPTSLFNSNFGTVSKATSNLPGVNFSAPRTGTLRIEAKASILPGQVAGAALWAMKLLESTTATDLAFASGAISTNNTLNGEWQISFVGYFSATASTTYNFKLQGLMSTGTLFIGAVNTSGSELSYTMEYIT